MKGACRVVGAKPALLLMLARRAFGEVTFRPVFPLEAPSNFGLPKPVIRDGTELDTEDMDVGLLPPPKPWMRLCNIQETA